MLGDPGDPGDPYYSSPSYSTLKARSYNCPHPGCLNSYVGVKSLLRHFRLHPTHNVDGVGADEIESKEALNSVGDATCDGGKKARTRSRSISLER